MKLAIAEMSLNLYSPLVDIEYKFKASAEYPIISIAMVFNVILSNLPQQCNLNPISKQVR
jgi:hypothetical protein